ncbi:MAG: serine/threonine-protein kinase [Gemmataceae bacterium]
MTHPVETLCNALARGRILTPDEVRELRQAWVRTAGTHADDGPRFRRWLVERKAVTDFQLAALDRGNADQLHFGSYRILDRIGRGRMAGIYKAVHEFGPTVAIKVLPASKAKDATTLARFQREARLSVRLKHPNVVRTFQTGRANGLYFIAMEHLDGETLEEALARRHTLDPAEAVRLVHQALQGLDHIHEQGLIHRDLKPANLMLVGGTPESTLDATVKILDIGLGKALFDEGGPTAELTNEDDLLGTAEYMSPEQARDPRSADIRADIYSLGCVLYHTLTGQPPFAEKNHVRLLVRHATEPPRPVRELNPAVPDGLQQILDWMLAKDPADRYPTPQRAAQALHLYLAAGSRPVPLEADPRMLPYLDWLDEQDDEAIPPTAGPPNPPASPPPPDMGDTRQETKAEVLQALARRGNPPAAMSGPSKPPVPPPPPHSAPRGVRRSPPKRRPSSCSG